MNQLNKIIYQNLKQFIICCKEITTSDSTNNINSCKEKMKVYFSTLGHYSKMQLLHPVWDNIIDYIFLHKKNDEFSPAITKKIIQEPEELKQSLTEIINFIDFLENDRDNC